MGRLRNAWNSITGQPIDISAFDTSDIAELLRVGGSNASVSGRAINDTSAMKTAAAWRCVNLISSVIATMPLDVILRVDERTRKPAVDHPLRHVLTVKPNSWQTPKQFKQLMQTWLLLRGNAHARIVKSRGRVLELLPLHPDRTTQKRKDGVITYEFRRDNGTIATFAQDEILHLVGMSLDGYTGLSVLSHMREALSISLDGEEAASTLMKHGSFVDGVITHPAKMSKEAHERLRESWDANRSGVKNTGGTAILEEGAKLEKLSMSSADLQFMEQRDFQRYDIAMFFGVPPHMIGATNKTTSWGSGIEQQNIGFVTYSLNDWIVTWQETLKRDCLSEGEQKNHDVRLYPVALLKGDTKAQSDWFFKMRQMGVYNPNEVRELLDENPRTLQDGSIDPAGYEYSRMPNETQDEKDDTSDEPTVEPGVVPSAQQG